MQFNSFIFILAFLPATCLLYYLSNKISNLVGKIILLISSVIFYTYSGWSTFIVLGISLAVNYVFSIAVMKLKKRRTIYLLFPVLINIALLLYFKYLNFAITNINHFFSMEIPLKDLILPVGISFFTFQQIAYIVAVYRGELERNHLLDYLVYILYFPKILMGPLAEPAEFIGQINDASLRKL